ncbi:MAG: hypothetical protein DWQ01_19875 [Planctomycetota bacterium]|nr:MAG: hypothetical protein DWQ01_19875 [Planctomycetota bacterium]
MSPTPLHQRAEATRNRLSERAKKASQAHPELAEQLEARIPSKARVSVNMKPSALERFLDGEPRLNAFEWAEQESRRSGRSVSENLRQKLGPWFHKRLEFEQKAGDGRHFHYGALNLGGMGAPQYGRYCVVDARNPESTQPDPVWIGKDSLAENWFREPFRKPGIELIWEKLQAWLAPWDQSANLALLKLSSEELPSDKPLEWQICRNEDYIEALSLEPITLDCIEEIRSETDDELQARALNAELDEAGMAEKIDLERHEQIRSKAATLGIEWLPVNSC